MVTKVRFRNFGQVNREGIQLQYNFDNGRYEIPKNDVRELDNSNWLIHKGEHETFVEAEFETSDESPF